MTEHLELLLRLHDGDDRCACLRKALTDALDNVDPKRIEADIEDCLRQHPAGSRYRA
jgi:hypothetical protein